MPIFGLDKIDLNEYASKDQPYIEQYKRMMRWYRAIQPVDLNSRSHAWMPSYLTKEDIFFAFFTTCYHLKDWLAGTDKKLKDKANKYVTNSPSLKICDELCNRSKHSKLDPRKEKPDRNLYTKGYELVVLKNAFGSGPSYHDSVYIIERDKKRLDALKIASACIKEWDNFLVTQKLGIPVKEL